MAFCTGCFSLRRRYPPHVRFVTVHAFQIHADMETVFAHIRLDFMALQAVAHIRF